jgi:uncharacterized membrane protein YhaH (DUF805 family)
MRVAKILVQLRRSGQQGALWLALLAVMLIDALAFGIIGGFELFDGNTMAVERRGSGWLWVLLLVPPSLWIVLVVSVKRWHDRNKSGRWVLVNLVPVIGWLWQLIECGFLRGTVGPNRFGQDPLRPRAISPI